MYICIVKSKMKKQFLHIVFSLLLCVVYLANILAPLDRHDENLLSSARQQTISQHECAGKELHKNIEFQHYCLACYRQSIPIISFDNDFVLPNLFPDHFYCQRDSFRRSLRVITPPPLRGPPSLLTFA